MSTGRSKTGRTSAASSQPFQQLSQSSLFTNDLADQDEYLSRGSPVSWEARSTSKLGRATSSASGTGFPSSFSQKTPVRSFNHYASHGALGMYHTIVVCNFATRSHFDLRGTQSQLRTPHKECETRLLSLPLGLCWIPVLFAPVPLAIASQAFQTTGIRKV